jgi:hypothetical protein
MNAGIGFKTVAETVTYLHSVPGVQVKTSAFDGWLIVEEPAKDAQWSFTPAGHYAFPTVVKRAVRRDRLGNLYVEMSALCENEWTPCEDLVSEFSQLNEVIRQRMQPKAFD